jgi:glycerol-1-phosphate dehydrogenase [NAD(P)+]
LTATGDLNSLSELVFGAGVLARGVAAIARPYALLAQPEPLEQADPSVREQAAHVLLVGSLDEAELERLAERTPEVAAVLGLGGGTAMDAAKFVALRRGVPLLLAPSAVSVDASVTNTVAVRAGGKVDYRGFVVAERVFIDFTLIGQAPERMNRAGAGDLLSIHTAVWDWRHGAGKGGAELVPEVARRAEEILELIASLAGDIRAVSRRGIEAVVRCYAEINEMANALGHAQLEEGSEHYFVYCLENVTGRSFIHGEAVTLGTVLMSVLQRNEPARVRAIADAAGTRWRAAELGLTPDDIAATLRRLPGFVRAADLPWSVIDQAVIDEAAISRLTEAAR